MRIDMSHGSGGKQMSNLINDVFLKHFDNKVLRRLEDAAVVQTAKKIAFTTDSFVVTPLFFHGGDIGKLAICGTVNDLLMMGAKPKYLTCGFIIEEGCELETIENIVLSMKAAAAEARVKIVAGDTKVIEGKGGIYINTAGIGEIMKDGIGISKCKPGNAIILSGNLGEHHGSIISERMGIQSNIKSDCAPLRSMVLNLLQNNIHIKCMRDVTRGGLATVLCEIASSSLCGVEILENSLPITKEVTGLCGVLGLDPLYMANEGKMIAVVPKGQAQKALQIIRRSKYGQHASIIGSITQEGGVRLITALQGKRMIDVLYGEGLPRIC